MNGNSTGGNQLQQNGQDVSGNQNNNSFHDYLQSSAHNLSFTNLHQTSFEIEDAHQQQGHNNLPLSPVNRSSTYTPQSFLSKPFEENNYEVAHPKQSQRQQWRYNWQGNRLSTPLTNLHESNTPHLQNQISNHLCSWENGFTQEGSNGGHHSENEIVSGCFANGILNESNLFADAKHSSREYHRRSSSNAINGFSQNQNINNSFQAAFGNDMDEEIQPSGQQHTMDIEGFESGNTPSLFKRNTSRIIMNYENYQQRLRNETRSPSQNFRSTEGVNNELKYSPITMMPPSYFMGEVSNVLPSFEQQGITGGAASYAQNSQACICNCKKTKCLKLYCECFSKLGYCGEGCHCHQCKNRTYHEEERSHAIQEAKLRNPDAFQPKVVHETEQQQLENKRRAANEQLKKGCNCRKTKCLKKYCECFNAGAYCSTLCKCDSCENHTANSALHLVKKGGTPAYGPSLRQSLIVSYQPSVNNVLPSNVQNASHRPHFIDSTSLYKTTGYQGRILFDEENEDSDASSNPNNYNGGSCSNFSAKQRQKKYIIHKNSNILKSKKPIIKKNLDGSDDDPDTPTQENASNCYSLQQDIVSQRRARKRVIDLEKKLKQIQQVQILLQEQQQLKEEQEQQLNTLDTQKFDAKQQELLKKKQELQEIFASPPSNEELDEENLLEPDRAPLKKTQKKTTSKKKNETTPISEERKQNNTPPSSSLIEISRNSDTRDHTPIIGTQNYVSSFTTSLPIQNSNYNYLNLNTRLNTDNYEYIRKKSIQNCAHLSQLATNPTKYSSNLFDPSSYNRRNDDPSFQYNEYFPYNPPRIKKSSSHFIKAP